MKLGLDLCGVVRNVNHKNPRDPKYHEPDAVECIKELVQTIGPQNCFIVSKMERLWQDPNRKGLRISHFFRDTDFLERNLVFVDEFDDHWTSKKDQVEKLGITHFVDDQIRVLTELPLGVKPYWYCTTFNQVDVMVQRAKWGYPEYRNRHYQQWCDLKTDLLLEYSTYANRGK